MFRRLFARRRRNESIAYSLYGAIVAQARQPSLYTHFGVPDTLDGRFDMIVLHAFLVLHRLKDSGEAERQLGQDLFDAFVKDMDRSLREIGIGDMGVPKRVKRMAEAFYGRVAAYGAAIGSADSAELAEAIRRNVFPDSPEVEKSAKLADYARAVASHLADEPLRDLLAGQVHFPAPDSAEHQAAA